MDEKHLEEKLEKLRSSMDDIPVRTDKNKILNEIKQNNRNHNWFNYWIYASSIACVLLLSLLVIQSADVNLTPSNHQTISLPEESEEALELKMSIIKFSSNSTDSFLSYRNNQSTTFKRANPLEEKEYYQPTYLNYNIILENVWDEPIGSIKGLNLETNHYENGISIHLEPQKELLNTMDEVLGFNLFDQPHKMEGDPVLSTLSPSSYSLSYIIGSNITSDDLSPLPSVRDMDRLLEQAQNVEVVVTLKNKELGRFPLEEAMSHLEEVPKEDRREITYNQDNMDRGNHDYLSQEHGPIIIEDTNNSNVSRGDIIYFQMPDSTDYQLSRVVGLPGEIIEIKEGVVYINGETLNRVYNKAFNRGLNKEDYFKEMERVEADYSRSEMETYFNQDMESIQIPNDSVFILGDQWWRSIDSRTFGPLPMRNIIGKVMGYKE